MRIRAQFVHLRDSVHAAHCATRCAALGHVILPPQIFWTVMLQRNAGPPTLLGTPMHETVFADVEVTTARTAMPVVRLAVREVLLKAAVVRKIEHRRADRQNVFQNPMLAIIERLQLTMAVVDEADRRREPQCMSTAGNRQ